MVLVIAIMVVVVTAARNGGVVGNVCHGGSTRFPISLYDRRGCQPRHQFEVGISRITKSNTTLLHYTGNTCNYYLYSTRYWY